MTQPSSARQVAIVFTLLATLHSLLASRQAKELACRAVGPRWRNGLYRPAYMLISLVIMAWATPWFMRLPDRELYRVPAPWSWLLRLGQLLMLATLAWTGLTVGPLRFTGLTSLIALLRRQEPAPAPEAQGPAPDPDGELKIAGPFRYTRHPDNLPFLVLALLFPRMTVNRAMLAACGALYAIIGSLHEDYRLQAAYGEAFTCYRRRVPFFLPRLRTSEHRARRTMAAKDEVGET